MVNKSGNIGTATETAVVNVLHLHGFPHAERRRLHGAVDLGDVVGTPGVCWEVKGGEAARNASDAQVAAWLTETDRERRNSCADIGVLVVARKGIGLHNAHRWWAIVKPYPINGDNHQLDVVARLYLVDACKLLRIAGYGTPRAAA